MTLCCPTLIAQVADGAVRQTFEWGRIQDPTDWILPVGAFLAVGIFVWVMYLRDSVELHPLLGGFLPALRTATFLALLILYLQPRWRSEREVSRNSRVVLLVDTSLSMGLTDAVDSSADSPSAVGSSLDVTASRIRRVATALSDTDLLRRLRETHDVIVRRFDETLDRDQITLNKLADGKSGDETKQPPDWIAQLNPDGSETRLGMALRQVINDETGSTLAGIVVFTDGGQNAGIPPEAAIHLARKAKIPIFPVGLGSKQPPKNVRVSDLVAPARAYPGDDYTVTGYVQGRELAGEVIEVQLLSRSGADGPGEPGSGQIEETQQITMGKDGEAVAVKFQLSPGEPGRRTLCFRVIPPEGDHNQTDNLREVDVEIVDRKSRVLLFAGGPMREYRFLRNLLHRDRSTTLHVLLQSILPEAAVSQEADKLLDSFPATNEEMYQYDCVLAFDPNWIELGKAEVDVLERWVADQGGGLVVVAGPVFCGQPIGGWIEDPDMAKIRALYPVEFRGRMSVIDEGLYTTEEPWQLDFTREGLEAEYLWLEDSATAGRQAWAGFEGVYGFCPVRGPKPAATVLSRFSDPRAAHGGEPVYFASQFYGSGRVFYLGSAEMWRLRKLDEAYFEQFYTKLIRHVSQGRLLRGSPRGVLLVGRDRYLLGNTVEVRAKLNDAQLEPLDLPAVGLQVLRPGSSIETIELKADPMRVGNYAGRFPVLTEGSYRLSLKIPESEEILTRRIQVKVPDLERENPQRNDPLLGQIANQTGGKYFDRLSDVNRGAGGSPAGSIVELLPDRTRTNVIPLAPDTKWQYEWLKWMLVVLCGLLCLEWLIRRLVRLA